MPDIEERMKALMLRGLAGDASAHADLLTAMSAYLRAFFARRLRGDSADVEDLVQDTLLAIHLKRETFDRRQPFTAWAYSIARYKLIDRMRRRKVRKTEPLDEAGALFVEQDEQDGTVKMDLDRLLSDLPDRQRGVLEDIKLNGLSVAEAAAKTGMSESAVKVSVHRSLKALAQKVRNENQ